MSETIKTTAELITPEKPSRIAAAAEALEITEVDDFGDPVVQESVESDEAPAESVEEQNAPEATPDASQGDAEAGEGDAESLDEDDSDASEATGSEDSDEEPSEAEGAEKEPPTDRQWARFRRQKQRVKAAEDQLAYREKQLLDKQSEFEAQQNKYQDPEFVINEYSRLTGKTKFQLYKEWTLNGVEFEQANKQLTPEQIREQVKADLRREAEEEKAQEKQKFNTNRQQFVSNAAQAALEIPMSDKWAAKYPFIASLDDQEIVTKVSKIVDWAIDNRPNDNFEKVLEELDKREASAYAAKEARIRELRGELRTEQSPSPGNPETRTTASGQSRPQKRTSISSADVGGGPQGAVPRTARERQRLAATKLPDFDFGF